MSSPFSSLNTALSAMRYQQAAIDIASTNAANATTEGYVRRRILGQTVGAAAVPAIWSRSNEIGSGVQSTGVQRLVDPLLDTRVRREHGRQANLDLKAAAMSRIEGGIAEPSENGVAHAIEEFKKAIEDLNNNPKQGAARSQVISAGATLADTFRIQKGNLDDEAGDQRARVLATVQEVNDVSEQLAATNLAISTSSGGGDTATLQDTRDRLALRLAELTGATATIRPDGGMDVSLGGQSLVSGDEASRLLIATGVNPDGTSDGNPVTFQVQPPAGAPVAVVPPTGELAASVELLDDVIPSYGDELDALAIQLHDAFNAAQAMGFDASGAIGGAFFAFDDPANPDAASLRVVATDADIAVSGVGGGPNTDTGNSVRLYEAITIEDGYQRLVNGFGSAVASVRRLADNQRAMSSQVDAAREQLTGVSIDEETVNMLLAQRSYEAAARVMTTVDQILDTLINRTGLVGR